MTSNTSSGVRSLLALHPSTRALSLNDVAACTELEAAAFPPQERATREKFAYRFGQCGSLSIGLFVTPDLDSCSPSSNIAHDEPGPTLIAHICSTLTDSDRVTDESMALPTPQFPANGHRKHGRTLCIHSLAVLPAYQGIGAGTMLMERYLRTMADEKLADRAAIIAHDHLIPYYERFGFVNLGPSQAQFGGGGWYDMVKDLAA